MERSTPFRRTLAIGDIHGCSAALRALLAAIDPGPDDRIITLGDFIDYGPDTPGVVEELIRLSDRCDYLPLMGNHEEMMLAALQSLEGFRFWMQCGGEPTLKAYGLSEKGAEAIPLDHLRFISNCRESFENDTHIFVHANYDPRRPIRHLSAVKLRWEFLEPARQEPHDSGKMVVVGHTPQRSGIPLDLGFLKGIDTDCSRGGWLTAFETVSGAYIQANQRGETRTLAPGSGLRPGYGSR